MDPISTLGTGLAVLGSKDILNKILGPTADYLGAEVKSFIEKCNINLDNIFVRAKNKLGRRLDEPGQVNPRVLKIIIDEGKFCEDPVVSDYYAGVLAKSKSVDIRDDRAIAILTTIKSLSTYQLHLHCLFYYLFHKKFNNIEKFDINRQECRSSMEITIPLSAYKDAMEFSDCENIAEIIWHSLVGLKKQNLIDYYFYGEITYKADYAKPSLIFKTEEGMRITPSLFGTEVFLWAQGIKSSNFNDIIRLPFPLPPPEIKIINGALSAVYGPV